MFSAYLESEFFIFLHLNYMVTMLGIVDFLVIDEQCVSIIFQQSALISYKFLWTGTI